MPLPRRRTPAPPETPNPARLDNRGKGLGGATTRGARVVRSARAAGGVERRGGAEARVGNSVGTSAFASMTPRDPSRHWLRPPENASVAYYASSGHAPWAGDGLASSAPQWSKSGSPRMQVYDPVRGERGMYFQVEDVPDLDSVGNSERREASWAAFRPGKLQHLHSLHPKLALRGPTGSAQLSRRLGPQHVSFDSVTCSSTSAWEREVVLPRRAGDDSANEKEKSARKSSTQKYRTHGTIKRDGGGGGGSGGGGVGGSGGEGGEGGGKGGEGDAVIPPWLELKMTGLAKTRSSSSATDVDSNETFQDQLENK